MVLLDGGKVWVVQGYSFGPFGSGLPHFAIPNPFNDTLFALKCLATCQQTMNYAKSSGTSLEGRGTSLLADSALALRQVLLLLVQLAVNPPQRAVGLARAAPDLVEVGLGGGNLLACLLDGGVGDGAVMNVRKESGTSTEAGIQLCMSMCERQRKYTE